MTPIRRTTVHAPAGENGHGRGGGANDADARGAGAGGAADAGVRGAGAGGGADAGARGGGSRGANSVTPRRL
ncbi:MAG: hypothetical protein QOK03_664, partial [Candidatus Binataceae bacterium]|nr:hypothetical protein [Candidatus Binataceae bacterium]